MSGDMTPKTSGTRARVQSRGERRYAAPAPLDRLRHACRQGHGGGRSSQLRGPIMPSTAPSRSTDNAPPVLVEVTRGAMVESRHRGSVAVSDAKGRLVLALGDVEAPVYARSAIKPLQALPLVESGAAERFGLGNREIALSCASHRGERAHTEAVASWLERLGLGPDDLECGSHMPYDPASANAMIRADEKPCPLHNNCSGKHTGFLATAR